VHDVQRADGPGEHHVEAVQAARLGADDAEAEWARVREEALAIARNLGPAPEGGFAFEPPYLVVLARRG